MCSTALRGLSSVASGLVRRQSAWPLHLHVRNAITLRRNFCARANAAHALDDASSEKLGSASPWATDGWGDSVEIIEQTMPDAHRALLSNASVAIPTSSAEAGELPAVSDILGAYEAQLQRRTARHLGYPYNLDYQNRELDRFMRYSINNLGDPFVPSNYGQPEPPSTYRGCMQVLTTAPCPPHRCPLATIRSRRCRLFREAVAGGPERLLGLRDDVRHRGQPLWHAPRSRDIARRHRLHVERDALFSLQGGPLLPTRGRGDPSDGL